MDYDSLATQIRTAVKNRSLEECIETVEETGLTYLDGGTTREVFKLPHEEFVIKFSRRRKPYQNENEATVWNNAPDDLKSALLPVDSYASDFRWVVMPKAEPAKSKPANIRAVQDKMRESDWDCKDKNPGNIGWYNEELVLIDYGSGCGPGGIGKSY